MASSPTKSTSNRTHTSWRWFFILLASVLLHLLVIEWVSGSFRLPSMDPSDHSSVIKATLLSIPKPVLSADTSAARPKSNPRPKPPQPKPASPPATAAAESTPALAAADPAKTDTVAVDPAKSDTQAADSANSPSDTKASDTAPTSNDAATAGQGSGVHYLINLPPSADLKYDVKKIPKEGAPTYGSGTISWHTNGSSYTVDGNFGILFITALSFQSTGTIENIGIAPELYIEKRFRRPETDTHFNRERNTISFSSSTLSYPRTGGEQDRATIIWQLAGIGRGDGGKFVPGTAIDLFVAGVRDGETWHIQIIGQEDLTIDGKTVRAWHVMRAPRPGSYDQILDIWLAPDQNWYPVRLRYTENNGDYLEMSLSNLNVSAVP